MSIPSSRSRIVFVYLGALLVAGAFYVISCAPGALWQDSGLIQYRLWHNDIEGFLGLAVAHPLYYIVALVAKVVSFGDFAHRVNLVSALAGAVAVANLYLLMRLWLGRAFPAILAAVTLAVSHTFWRHACIAETYTLWTALFLGELILLLRYSQTRRIGYLYVLGLLNGLALAVHMLACIPLACYAVLLIIMAGKKTIRARDVVFAASFWMIGALPYEYLIVKNMIQSGDILGTLSSAAFGERWRGDVLNAGLSWRMVRENVLFLVLNFPTPNALLALVGGAALWRVKGASVARGVVLALMAMFFVFAFRYTVADRYAFFIPFYVMVSLAIGAGAHRVRHRALASLVVGGALLPVAVYAAAPTLAARWELPIGTRHDIAYRDDYAYFLQPWKTGYRGAERFAREALAAAAPEALIYADTTTVAPLLYLQEAEGRRPDVKIITGFIRSAGAPPYDASAFEEHMGRCAVYVTSPRPGYCPEFILGRYDFVQQGLLWRVIQPPVTADCGSDR